MPPHGTARSGFDSNAETSAGNRKVFFASRIGRRLHQQPHRVAVGQVRQARVSLLICHSRKAIAMLRRFDRCFAARGLERWFGLWSHFKNIAGSWFDLIGNL
jgi:hypothetical protein